ncbi:MAG: hypothetical protein HYU65_02815 [Armatimonadetes bacterium]|nr:hypothetical protein [Armatimonadota bacterium]
MRVRALLFAILSAGLMLAILAGQRAHAHGKEVNVAVTCITPDPARPLVKLCTASLRYTDGDAASGASLRLIATRDGGSDAPLDPVVFRPTEQAGIYSATITFPAYGRWRMRFQSGPGGGIELVEEILPPIPGSSPELAARLQLVLRFGAADVRNLAARGIHLLAAGSWLALVALVLVITAVVPVDHRWRSLHRVARLFPWAGGASLLLLGMSGMYLARFNAPSPAPGLFAPAALAALPFGRAYFVVFLGKMIVMLAMMAAAAALALALRRSYRHPVPAVAGAAGDIAAGAPAAVRWVGRLALLNIGLSLLAFISVTILSYLHMIAHVGAAAGAR